MAIVGFAVAFGAAWFVVSEQYRDAHPPAQRPAAQNGTADDQFRQMIRTETDLVRGTARLVRIIPQLSPQQAAEMLAELAKTNASASPISRQAGALLRYRSEQAPEKLDRTERHEFHTLVFDYSNPFSLPVESVAADATSFEVASWDGGGLVPMSALHWALVWLDRRSPAEALAFIEELGPAWQESATKWLSDFVGNKTFAEATPWLDRIASPSARSIVTDALVSKWMQNDGEAAGQWVMERPEARLPNVISQAVAILQRRPINHPDAVPLKENSGIASFLILTLAPEEQLRQINGTSRLWQTLLLSRDPDFIAHLGNPSNRAVLRTICERLTVQGGKFNEWDALHLLERFDDRYRPDFQEKVRSELIALWARSRDKTTWGPCSTLLLQLTGLPVLPWFIPLPSATEP